MPNLPEPGTVLRRGVVTFRVLASRTRNGTDEVLVNDDEPDDRVGPYWLPMILFDYPEKGRE